MRRGTGGLLVDNFAGGGGASEGIRLACGRDPDIAINHDAAALSMHAVNHPDTLHLREDVFDVDIVRVCKRRPVELAWFSPDCTFHSKARGGQPFRDPDKALRRRGLAWVAVKWARSVRPRVICLENVEEFEDWGPLDESARPDPEKRGLTFRRWVAQLQNLGYEVSWAHLRASDYGAPTTRKRLFLVARCDGEPIIWPEPSHGPGRMFPFRTAAECIDWSLPVPSIFNRARPLAENTLRRIARGIDRFVLQTPAPFIVPMRGTGPDHLSIHPVDAPLSTVSAQGTHHALVTAYVAPLTHQGGDRGRVLSEPLPTVTGAHRGEQALVTAFLAKHYGGVVGQRLDSTIGTVTAIDHHSLVTVHLDAQRRAEAEAFLMTRCEGVPDIRIGGGNYHIVDIGLRMLSPRELFNAQGFRPDYIIDRGADGAPFTKTEQIRMCGNSVCPPIAAAIISANVREMARETA